VPGYLGSPRRGSAALGEKIWKSFAAAAIEHLEKVLDGTDPAAFQRYADLLERNPLYQDWMKAAADRDAELDTKQREWLRMRNP